jgi:hypothetical protein
MVSQDFVFTRFIFRSHKKVSREKKIAENRPLTNKKCFLNALNTVSWKGLKMVEHKDPRQSLSMTSSKNKNILLAVMSQNNNYNGSNKKSSRS